MSIRWKSSDFSTSTPRSHTHAALSTGGKAGIGVGVAFGVLLSAILALLLFYFRRQKSVRSKENIPCLRQSSDKEPTTNENLTPHDISDSHSPSTWTRITLDSWFYEIAGLFFGFVCFIAMVCVLCIYQEQSTPEVPYGITLNTLISILATASKASLAFAVGECIGQLKWSAFQSPRPLHYIQAYDSAGRGPWGSFLLLIQSKSISLLNVGALIMILALAFDPFVQQIITYPTREVTTSSPSAAVKQSYSMPQSEGGWDFIDASNAAFWTNDFAINPICPSGNCTWPLFQSIEMCSKCEDVTSSATLIGCDPAPFNASLRQDQPTSCNVSLAQGDMSAEGIEISPLADNGYIMSIPKDLIWVVDKLQFTAKSTDLYFSNVLPNKTYVGVENPVYVVAHATLALPGDDSATSNQTWLSHPEKGIRIQQATQCILSPCARTHRISVSGGVPSSSVTEEDFGFFYPEYYDNWVNANLCWKPGTKPPVGGSGDYLINGGSQHGNPADMSSCLSPAGPAWTEDWKLAGSSSWSLERANWNESEFSWRILDIQNSSQNAAKIIDFGLSTVVQRMAASLSKLARDSSSKTATGIVSTQQTYVKVNWPWVTLPALLLALGIILVFSTIMVNKRQRLGLWKSSILPVLYHGLENEYLTVDDESTDISQMDEAARNVNVKLGLSDTQGRLVLRG